MQGWHRLSIIYGNGADTTFSILRFFVLDAAGKSSFISVTPGNLMLIPVQHSTELLRRPVSRPDLLCTALRHCQQSACVRLGSLAPAWMTWTAVQLLEQEGGLIIDTNAVTPAS